jgi:hypothetical protein
MDGKFDAVSCTGYFGLSSGQRASFNSSTTGSQVAQAVLNNVPSALSALQTHKNLGQQFGGGREIRIYAYESGQHADGQGNAGLSYLSALYAAQTDPLMFEAYDDFLRGFYDMSGDLAMHFTYVSRNDKNGSWGALQSQTQPISGAPKYRALAEAVAGLGYDPEYTVAAVQAAGEEFGAAPITFRIARSGDKSVAQDVSFQLGGTAGAADYVNPGSSVHFAAGQAAALVNIVPVDDSAIEDLENVTLTLLSGAGYKLDGIASRNTATGSIVDDDGYVNANLPIVNPNFETGDLSGWTKIPSSNNLIGVAPPAPGGSVVNAPPAPVEGARWAWGAGATGNDGGGALTAGIAQTLSLASHATGIDAGGARLVFSGWGSGWSNDFAQFELRYYNASGAQLGTTLASNVANTDKTWTKMTADTAVPAGTRSVQLRATMNRAGGSLSDAGVDALTARLTYPIVPVVNVSVTDASAVEPGSNTATFTVTRAGSTLNVPLTVNYAVSGTATGGSDYAGLSGAVTIPSGSTSVTVIVTALDDIVDEPDETVVLSLVGMAQYALGASSSATATIADNDLPRVTITPTDDLAAEAGQDPATFVVERLTEVLGQPLTVNYTLGGTASSGDYQAVSGSVTIPANESVAALTLVPINDTTVEHDETVVVTLSPNSSYTVSTPASATATIANDDHPRVTVAATDAAAAEAGADPATFTFTRTGEFINEDLTVYFDTSGSATPGEDYTLPALGVTIPAGALSASVSITPIADNFTEGTENVVLTLLPNGGYTVGSPASATATIADAVSTGNLPSWVAPGSVASWNQPSKTLTVTGIARIIANPGGGQPPTINIVGAGAVLAIAPTSGSLVRVGALHLSNGAVATLESVGVARTAANHRVLRVTNAADFTIDSTSTLDLADNDLILDYSAPASPIVGVEGMVRSGFNVTGDWLGRGIRSSVAAADGGYALAVADNSQLSAPFGTGQGGPLFAGQNVDPTTVLVKFSHRVDMDLDGDVGPNDASIFGTNFSEGDAAQWSIGDLDYDGMFTPNDASVFGTFYDGSLAEV